MIPGRTDWVGPAFAEGVGSTEEAALTVLTTDEVEDAMVEAELDGATDEQAAAVGEVPSGNGLS